jgi:Tfp pilus assembly protein PilX
MANSFDKQKAIDDVYAAVARAEQVVSDIERAFNATRTEMTNIRSTVATNANGYFANPDDRDWLDAKLSALRARMSALGA